MMEGTHEYRTDVAGCSAEPADQLAPWEPLPSESQGTDSVRGTWCSEGDAGHHQPFQTEPQRTPSPMSVTSRLEWIASQAREYPDEAFTTLAHYIDEALLERAFWSLNPRSCPGIDRMTWQDYKRNLETHLEDLHKRLVSGTYVPQMIVRRWIPKSPGKFRPLGIPALEDKIVQGAVALLLEQIYEQDFYDFSYGFRPGRSCHQALHASRLGMLDRVRYVIDCDIKAFFDNLRHDQLLAFLRKRVKDGRLLKLIEMWLKAGIMDGKDTVFPEKGSPQGSVISPLLANVYLHEVLDTWFAEVVTAHCRGKVVMYRYADDFVIGFELEEDARRIMAVLPKRFARYGLEINEEKTRLVDFRRPRWGYDPQKHGPKPDTFSFLGFTIYWGKTWKGGYTIKRKTETKRMIRSVRNFWQWCRDNRHRPLEEQYAVLSAKLRGYYQYYGVRCNSRCLEWVFDRLKRAWRYWLNRRGGRKKLSWSTLQRLLKAFSLPRPKIVQSWV
jgi:group II intron reverse transcriptase/maturase